MWCAFNGTNSISIWKYGRDFIPGTNLDYFNAAGLIVLLGDVGDQRGYLGEGVTARRQRHSLLQKDRC